MKVLHVLSSNEYNGAENIACQIINMFDNNQGYEMYYCSPDGPIRKALETQNITFIPIDSLNVKVVKDVTEWIEPDIIHAHDRKASLVCALAKRNHRLISHMHNNPIDARKFSKESLGYAFAGLRAEQIIWVSQEAYDEFYFKKLLQNKSVVLKNVISADRINRLAEEDTQVYNYDVVFVGRMVYQKNPERFVEIIKLLTIEHPDIKTAMVGTGELEENVKQLIKDLELTNNIDYLGYKDNPYGIIKASKVLLLPSRWEGLPMVQLEAEALGTNVVRTPGTNEGLADRVNHCLVLGTHEYLSGDSYAEYKKRLNEIYAG